MLTRRLPLVGAIVLALTALSSPEPAGADITFNFTVNSPADLPDANLADGRCDADLSIAGDQCTLRAAIQQGNGLFGTQTSITLPAGPTS
jgi:CSLREA domain-containing protein